MPTARVKQFVCHNCWPKQRQTNIWNVEHVQRLYVLLKTEDRNPTFYSNSTIATPTDTSWQPNNNLALNDGLAGPGSDFDVCVSFLQDA